MSPYALYAFIGVAGLVAVWFLYVLVVASEARWWEWALGLLVTGSAATALILAASMAGKVAGDVIRQSGYTVGGVTFQERR